MVWDQVRPLVADFRRLAEGPRQSPFDTRALPVYVLMLVAWGLVILTVLMTGFSYDGSLSRIYLALAVLALGAMGLRYLSLPRIAGCIEGSVLKLLMSSAAGLGSGLLASTARPLADTDLIRWDSMLGFDWLALIEWLSSRPFLVRLLDQAYDSLLWQPWLVVPALFLAGKDARCWALLLAWSIALCLTMAVFPLLPAVGPIVHHGVSLSGIRLRHDHVEVFEGLRNGTLRELGTSTIRGMVTIPSFHVAGAVLLGWGFAGLRYFKWPFILINLVMLLSAIPIGGHYLVDVIAGVLVAVAGIQLAKLILARPVFSGAMQRHARQPLASTA